MDCGPLVVLTLSQEVSDNLCFERVSGRRSLHDGARAMIALDAGNV